MGGAELKIEWAAVQQNCINIRLTTGLKDTAQETMQCSQYCKDIIEGMDAAGLVMGEGNDFDQTSLSLALAIELTAKDTFKTYARSSLRA